MQQITQYNCATDFLDLSKELEAVIKRYSKLL